MDDHDYQFQLSGGYTFEFGLSIDAGWKIANESHQETQTLGVLAAYVVEF